MDLWLVLSDNHISDINRSKIIDGTLNTEAFEDIKVLAEILSKKGIIIRSPLK